MTERGVRWSRTSVAKLEGGKRAAITAQELLALALVFDLPPVLLLADPRADESMPLADGTLIDAWAGLLWLSGARRAEDSKLANYPYGSIVVRAGWDVMDCVTQLNSRRDGLGSHLTEEAAARARVRDDERQRDALERLSVALELIIAARAPVPSFVDLDAVYARARELGTWVTGMDVT